MIRKSHFLAALVAGLAFAPAAAFAHPGGAHTHGLLEGLAHPVSGLDHLAAMTAVGVIAAQFGGRALWLVPASFVGAMIAGAILGMAGLAAPMVETAIAFSLVAFGALVAFRAQVPCAAVMATVAVFGFFHGLAHGSEAPADASGLSYILGFTLATAALHLCGAFAGLRLGAMRSGLRRAAFRSAGGATAALGIGLALGII
jgi:urease accessory protein